jgi:hypothetical protein
MNPNTMPDKVSKVDNKPNIPPVTNSNIIQMPIRIPVPKPLVLRQPSPPRKCRDCNSDILPHSAMYMDICKTCFGKIDDEARRRHY